MRSLVVVCALVACGVAAATFPCGTLYGWSPSDDFDGFNVQELDLASGAANTPMAVPFDSDSEESAGVVYGRRSRVIYFFTTENIYLYEIDIEKVIQTIPFDNEDGGFQPMGYDDVHGHVWGVYTDEFDQQWISRADVNTGELKVDMGEIQEGATLYYSEEMRTLYQVTPQEDESGHMELLVETDMFAMHPPVNFTYPIVFPETNELTLPQFSKVLPNGGVLVFDEEGNYYLVTLQPENGNGQIAAGLAATAADFEAFETPFYNYVIGYYTGPMLDCDSSEDYICFAFWDSLEGMFYPFNVTINDPSGLSIGKVDSIIYYADSC